MDFSRKVSFGGSEWEVLSMLMAHMFMSDSYVPLEHLAEYGKVHLNNILNKEKWL